VRTLGILLLIASGALAAVGLALLLAARIPWLGHLPGDIHYEGKRSSFHFPIVSCVVLSLVLTIVLNLILRIFRK